MTQHPTDTKQYFEDIEIGDKRSFGSETITKGDIIEFAKKYDPQPIHLDESAAANSMMEGLVASGWHTAATCMRMIVEHMEDRAFAGARGIDTLRWIEPVRPGDTLSVEVEVIDKNSLPDDESLGSVDEKLTAYNQNGNAVMSWVALTLVYRQ